MTLAQAMAPTHLMPPSGIIFLLLPSCPPIATTQPSGLTATAYCWPHWTGSPCCTQPRCAQPCVRCAQPRTGRHVVVQKCLHGHRAACANMLATCWHKEEGPSTSLRISPFTAQVQIGKSDLLRVTTTTLRRKVRKVRKKVNQHKDLPVYCTGPAACYNN